MNFQVPQFIEIEDKIFGPLTFRQFIYLIGGGGISFLLYVILGFYLAVLPIVLVATISGALAFYKFNDRPFALILEAGVKYLFKTKLYLWKRQDNKTLAKVVDKKTETPFLIGLNLPKISGGRLKELSWNLDIKDKNELS